MTNIAFETYFFARPKTNDNDFLKNLEIGVHSQKNGSKSPKSKVRVQIRSGEEGPLQVTASSKLNQNKQGIHE